jgi:hypothetical protein
MHGYEGDEQTGAWKNYIHNGYTDKKIKWLKMRSYGMYLRRNRNCSRNISTVKHMDKNGWRRVAEWTGWEHTKVETSTWRWRIFGLHTRNSLTSWILAYCSKNTPYQRAASLILYRVGPLLDNDLETNETSAARQQILNKYTQPLLGNASQTNTFPRKRLEYNNERCFISGPCRDIIIETYLEVRQSWKGVCEGLVGAVQNGSWISIVKIHYRETTSDNRMKSLRVCCSDL